MIVWQKAMNLVSEVYVATKAFPNEELYCLTSQMRRSAISIPSNIAEGYGRHSTNDYKHFLQITVGSLYELQTQVEISLRLNYLPMDQSENITSLCIEIDKMLYTLIQKINH